jgi:hypothetical protein
MKKKRPKWTMAVRSCAARSMLYLCARRWTMATGVCGVALILVVTGCATAPARLEEASPVPSERLLAFQVAEPAAQSVLVVTRDSGMVGKRMLSVPPNHRDSRRQV